MTIGIVLDITQSMLEEAKKHALDRIKFEYNRAQYNNEQRISMITIGTLGQLGFRQALEQKSIKNYTYQMQAGEYDDFDFTVGGKICEIKTSGFDSSGWERLNLLYSEDQFKVGIRKGFSYCFQLFVNGYDRKSRLLDTSKCNKLVIAGYIVFSDIKNFQNPRKMFWGDFYKVPLDKLMCFDSFSS
jgi:hypothetical protein